MATRTQKAAKKAKAETAKEPAATTAVAAAASKSSKRAKGSKAAKPAKAPKSRKAPQAEKAGKAPKPGTGSARRPARVHEEVVTLIPEPERVSLMERFWHRLGVRAQRKQMAAHVREAEREEAERRKAQDAAREAAQAKRAADRAIKDEARRLAAEKAAEAARTRKLERQARHTGRHPVRVALEPVPVEAPVELEEVTPEPEPAPKPVHEPKPAHRAPPAVAPAATPAAPTDLVESQADRFAAEMAARRSKPIQIADGEVHDAIPKLPVGRHGAPAKAEAPEVLHLDAAPPARIDTAPRGLSVPEQYLLLTLDDAWDERREKVRPGALGGALAGSLLLELAMHGKLRVQRDRFQVTDVAVDAAAAAVAAKLARWGDLPSLQAMKELAKWIPQLLPAYKDRMAQRDLVQHRSWRHLGLFYRSQTALLDADAQERLRNKLGRAIAGGGRPDAPTILALGLLEASGLFGLVVPEGAQQYNRKRLNGLLAGKDVMGYKVDDELKGLQEVAVRTILDNVRILTRQ